MFFRLIFVAILLMWSDCTFSSQAMPSSAMEQIVYMERISGSQGMIDSKHIHTLASALGSEEAAKKAILYNYRNTINGFSAVLTESQVQALSRQPGVLKILPALTYHLPQEFPASSP